MSKIVIFFNHGAEEGKKRGRRKLTMQLYNISQRLRIVIATVFKHFPLFYTKFRDNGGSEHIRH